MFLTLPADLRWHRQPDCSFTHAGLKGSTALSQAVVTGGACASFMYSSCKRHPEDDEQSLVDFDLALILTPMLLLGITAGKPTLSIPLFLTAPAYVVFDGLTQHHGISPRICLDCISSADPA